jgi:RNA-binding protein
MKQAQKKQLRTIGHKLNPVVIVSDRGMSEGIEQELQRALNDHELIKVKLAFEDPAVRKQFATELCEQCGAELVQAIGKIILIYKAAKKPNPKLSNIERNKHLMV